MLSPLAGTAWLGEHMSDPYSSPRVPAAWPRLARKSRSGRDISTVRFVTVSVNTAKLRALQPLTMFDMFPPVGTLNMGKQILTPRQVAVLQLATYGLSGRQIARHLGISVRTVHDHFARMRERTGAQSGSQLIAQAVAEGLVKPRGPAPDEAPREPRLAASSARTRRVGLAADHADDSDTAFERDVLAAAGCCPIFEEEADARNAKRHGLAAAMDCLDSGDVLVVWKITRLGSCIGELLSTVCCLYGRGAGVTIIDGNLAGEYAPDGDGGLFFTMAAALADLPR
jgi:DNA-binding CsgD family transcriptional regulator